MLQDVGYLVVSKYPCTLNVCLLMDRVLLGLSLLLGHDVSADLLGIAVGHCYYFAKWIYPEITHPNEVHLIRTPQWMQYLFMERDGHDIVAVEEQDAPNQDNNGPVDVAF